jgi:Mn2+/Fe2+ NRAMP family transporter
MKFEIWHVILLVAFILNIAVSIFISRRDSLNRFQKISQIVIVWLIPFIAAIGILLFHRSDEDDSSGSGPLGGGSSDSIGTQPGNHD